MVVELSSTLVANACAKEDEGFEDEPPVLLLLLAVVLTPDFGSLLCQKDLADANDGWSSIFRVCHSIAVNFKFLCNCLLILRILVFLLALVIWKGRTRLHVLHGFGD